MNGKIVSIVMCVVIVTSMFAVAGQSESEVKVLELVSHAYTIEESEGYHEITMEGFSIKEISGAPRLPQKIYDIELPSDADLSTVQLKITSKSTHILSGEYEIARCPPLIVGSDTILSDSIVNGSDMDIYENDEFCPSIPVEILETWQTGDKKTVRIQFTPFQYNPVAKKLRLNEKVDFRLSWRKLVDDILALLRKKEGYAIVTTNAIVNNSSVMSDFIVHLRSKGFEVYTVTENLYGTARGQKRAINIRKWLKDNYISLNIKYVLLIGNPDPDDPSKIFDSVGDVPMLMCWPDIRKHPDLDKPVPTDYFYADLTGDWDSDGDRFYGEYMQDAVDFGPEVYVGRIPVYNEDYEALDKILNKTIFYGGCGKKILLPMAILRYKNENRDKENRIDGRHVPQRVIENIAKPEGYDCCVMYERKGIDPVPYTAFGHTRPLNEENIIEEWKKGYGIVFWWSYGEPPNKVIRKYWSEDDGDGVPEESEMELVPFLTSETEIADTDTFTFQCTGGSGVPEDSNNLAYKLLEQGAISTVCASRFVVHYVCDWDTKNNVDSPTIGYNYIYHLLRYREPAGKALYTAKSSLNNSLEDGGWRNLFSFNLYGDPSLVVVPYESISSPTRTGPTFTSRPGYAIVTTEDIKSKSSNLRRFVIHLRNRGFEVYTVTEKMYGTAGGQQRAINIREWLKANYISLNIKYVLLIGNPNPDDPSGSNEPWVLDPDGGFGDVPMLMCWPDIYEADTDLDLPVPTDYFYADLTGDWDSDGDGFYGESFHDAVDLVPEVYVGRIPVYHEDYKALDKILSRTISYQCCSKRILLLMAISNFENEDHKGGARVDGRHFPEIVARKIADPNGYRCYIMYEGEGKNNCNGYFGYSAALNMNNVQREWANGYGVVFWWAHGNAFRSNRRVWTWDDGDGVPEWDKNELDAPAFLTSTAVLPERNTFTFQASCGNGHPEFSDSLGYTLLKNGSAICTVSSSRCSLYLMCLWGDPNGRIRRDTDEVTIGYWYIHHLINNGEPAGKALYRAKSELGKPGEYVNIFAFNLYGDPSLTVEPCKSVKSSMIPVDPGTALNQLAHTSVFEAARTEILQSGCAWLLGFIGTQVVSSCHKWATEIAVEYLLDVSGKIFFSSFLFSENVGGKIFYCLPWA